MITKPGLHFKWPLLQNVRLLRHAHPDLRRRRAGALPHLGEEARAGGFLRQVAHHRRAQYYVSRAGRRAARGRRALAQTINDGAARRVRQAHRARRGLRRARQDHEPTCARRPTRTLQPHRRRDRRRAPEARRPAAGGERVGLPPHGGGAQARRQRAALDRRGRSREDPRRRRPAARGDPRRGLPRRAEASRARATPRRAAIYAQAFAQNPEFYAFYRSLEAYRSSFRSKTDLLVLEPNSDFFRYLQGFRRQSRRAGNDGRWAPRSSWRSR